MKKVLNAKILPVRTEYLIQNMCRYDSYQVQGADIVLEKKEIKTSCASKYFCNLLLIPSFN